MVLVLSLQPSVAGAAQERALSIADVAVTEGDSGTVNAVFEVTISQLGGPPASVAYSTATDSAGSDDFQGSTGTITFKSSDGSSASGPFTKTIVISVTPDLLDEDPERFFVRLSGPVNATISDGEAVGTIADNDPLPSLSVADASVLEGDTGTVDLTLTVLLTPASGRTVSVDFATQDGNARRDFDYTAAAGTLNFAPGQRSKQVTVSIKGDRTDERDESFELLLSSPSNATISDGSAVAAILDDDPAPALAVNDVFVSEGDAGIRAATFTVTLSSGSGKTVSVNYALEDGSASSPSDYTATSGTLVFAEGETLKEIVVDIHGDTTDETDETFSVLLTDPREAVVADAVGVATILNDDLPPELRIFGTSLTEPVEGLGAATFDVRLSEPSSKEVTVRFQTRDGSATAPHDYAPTGGTVTLAPGATSTQITVPVFPDSIDEEDEAFFVDLTDAKNAFIVVGSAQGSILDSDDPPSISIADLSSPEGDGGPVPAAFKVTLSGPSGKPISIDVAAADGTAVAGRDYLPGGATLSFAPGETEKEFAVSILGDVVDETDETITVTLSNPVNVTIGRASATGTIVDDDASPSVSINDVSLAEPNTGTQPLTFVASLSDPSEKSISVKFASSDGTATAPSDYLPASGTLTFAPGEVTKSIVIQVVGDLISEADETFGVLLSDPTEAVIVDGTGTGAIIDGDPFPTLSISDVTVGEGATSITTEVLEDFEDATLAFPVTGSWARSSTSAASGLWGFKAASIPNSGTTESTFTINFPANSLNRKVTLNYRVSSECGYDFLTILVNGSQVRRVSCNSGWQTAEATAGLVAGNNSLIVRYQKDYCCAGGSDTAWVDNIKQSYATPTSGDARFTVALSQASGLPVSVAYSTRAGTATPGTDFTAVSGTLNFPPGQTTQTISVPVLTDALDEDNESFFVDLSDPTNVSITDGQAVATIVDDDATPSVSIGSRSLDEGDEGDTQFAFDLTLSAPSGKTISVNYSTSDGTAVSASDYRASSGILTIPAGATSQQVVVAVIGDRAGEGTETFAVNLSAPVNVALGTSQGIGTIVNDDPILTLTSTITSSYFYDHEGEIPARLRSPDSARTSDFFITLDPPQPTTVTVRFSTADATVEDCAASPNLDCGLAEADIDYVPASRTVTFLPGETFSQVRVDINGDTTVEADYEAFRGVLTEAVGADILVAERPNFIRDDDPLILGSIGDCFFGFCEPPTVPEFWGALQYNLYLMRVVDDGPFGSRELISRSDILVEALASTVDGTCPVVGCRPDRATPISDYNPVRRTLEFMPGMSGLSVMVQVVNDSACEQVESVYLTVDPVVNAQRSTRLPAEGKIYDDDCWFGP